MHVIGRMRASQCGIERVIVGDIVVVVCARGSGISSM